jgi:Na+/H+-dicarboxylate symporter
MPPVSLTRQILVAMLLGMALGATSHYLLPAGHGGTVAVFWQTWVTGGLLALVAGLFMALLKMLVVPLVFVSLVCGVTSSSAELSRLGRLGAATFALYVITTACAVVIALVVATLIQPGSGIDLGSATFSAPTNTLGVAGTAGSGARQRLRCICAGKPAASHRVCAVRWRGHRQDRRARTEKSARCFPKPTPSCWNWSASSCALRPMACLRWSRVCFADKGLDLFAGLAWYAFALLLALAIHVTLVYMPLLTWGARISPTLFFSRFREPMLVAFSTASSAATLPVTLRTVEQRLGVPRDIASFTLPLGATVNMDGTAIMQGVATCFIAQAYGIDLSAGAWLAIIATATLASIGTAAVPSAGLVTLTLVLTQVGLPFDAIGIIIGIDRFLDMARTTVNVTGDAVVTTVIARRQNRLTIPVEIRD